METTLNEQVYNAINEAELLHNDESKENVIEKGLIFTKAQRNQEIIDALSSSDLIDEVSVIGENFSGFGNGLLFKIYAL